MTETVCGLLQLLLVWSFFQILDEIEEHSIKIYHLPDAESDEDEDFKEQTRLLKVGTLFPDAQGPSLLLPWCCYLVAKLCPSLL